MVARAGEVALPGGKRDESDASDVDTALREAHEELGLLPDRARVLVTLRPLLSKHLISVRHLLIHAASVLKCYTLLHMVAGWLGTLAMLPQRLPQEAIARFRRRIQLWSGIRCAALHCTQLGSWMQVVPVIAVIASEHAQEALQSLVNLAEVQRVFAMPLRTFLQRKGHSSRDAVLPSGGSDALPSIRYRLHYFELEDLPICWGLTASILIEAAKLAFQQEPQFCEHPPGCKDYAEIWHNGSHILYSDHQ